MPSTGKLQNSMLTSQRLLVVSALATLQVSCVVVGAVAATTHGGSAHHAVAIQIAQPAATSSPRPTATASGPLAGLVVGPTPPTGVAASAHTDLKARILKLNPSTTIQEPDALVVGGFRSLHRLVSSFPAADRPLQRAMLTSEGFEGSEFHSWASANSQDRYLIDLTRFSTASGATRHLSRFTAGGLGAGPSTHQTTSPIAGGLAFFSQETAPGFHEFVQYQTVGRYFGIVIVRAPKSVSHAHLKAAGAVLAQAQRARMRTAQSV